MHLIMLAILVLPSPPLMAQGWQERILEASRLPVAAAEAREEGVSDLSIREYLDRVLRNRVPAEDAYRILDGEVRVVREGGPKDNFGAFVQTQLDAGLRGRALADAIHEEHRRRGMGRPDDRERGRSDDAQSDRRPGDRDTDRGRSAEQRDGERDRNDNRATPSRDTTKKGRRP